MPYTPTTWTNDSGEKINAANLNKIESGIDQSTDAIENHLADTSDTHDASSISISDAGGNFSATDVEGALGEEADARQAHEAAADPHAQYQRESEKDQNSGYVGLAASQGTRDGTKYLRDDGTWQTVSGGGASAADFTSLLKVGI